MSAQFKFSRISEPIQDVVTGELIQKGYQLYIPFQIWEKYNFKAKMKLYWRKRTY